MIRFFCPPSCRLLRKCPDPNVGLEDAPEPAVEHLSDANQSARGLRTIAGNRRERSLAAGNAAQFIPANDRTLPSSASVGEVWVRLPHGGGLHGLSSGMIYAGLTAMRWIRRASL